MATATVNGPGRLARWPSGSAAARDYTDPVQVQPGIRKTPLAGPARSVGLQKESGRPEPPLETHAGAAL